MTQKKSFFTQESKMFFCACVSLFFAGMLGGCFENREAPRRLATFSSLEEIEANKGSVECANLSKMGILEAIPAVLADCPKLEVLYLRDTKCENLDGLKSLGNLEILDLSGAKRGAFDFVNLPKLRHLYLANCDLEAMPNVSSEAIIYLNFDRNKIASISDVLPSNLKFLRLNKNEIKELPLSLFECKKLVRIYLASNKLEKIPEEIASLLELEDLMLAENNFSEFPEALLKLPKLRNLDLSMNRGITKLPENIGEMKALRTLILSRCSIPAEERERITEALPNCTITF